MYVCVWITCCSDPAADSLKYIQHSVFFSFNPSENYKSKVEELFQMKGLLMGHVIKAKMSFLVSDEICECNSTVVIYKVRVFTGVGQ